jgi:hypothetical protein
MISKSNWGLGVFKWIAIVLASLLDAPATATTVDTTDAWSGAITYGWFGSGTSLIAPDGATSLDSISFFFEGDAAGQTFDFWIASDFYSANVLFEQSFTAVSGQKTFLIDLALEPGDLLYTFMDFGDYAGYSTLYTPYDTYSGGLAYFLDSNGYWIWDFSQAIWEGGSGGLDEYYSQIEIFGDDLSYLLRAAMYWIWGLPGDFVPPEEFNLEPDLTFVANFSTPVPVPLPATGLMLLTGIGSLVAFRRRKAVA